MSDGMRRLGRGGAGNFMSESGSTTTWHADVQAQDHPARVLDLEAQKLPGQPQPYARGGRGGAGNFHDPANVPEESREQVAERSGTAVALPAGRSGLTGRGGAGNWSDSIGSQNPEEARKKEELADRVVRNVDAELAMPPKIYTPPIK